MRQVSRLNDHRLELLYNGADFGGETTMRARVIRELIDEIRSIRKELDEIEAEMVAAGIR